MGLKKYYRFLYRKVVGALNPLKYARKIGVNMYEGGYIYTGVFLGERNLGLLRLETTSILPKV